MAMVMKKLESLEEKMANMEKKWKEAMVNMRRLEEEMANMRKEREEEMANMRKEWEEGITNLRAELHKLHTILPVQFGATRDDIQPEGGLAEIAGLPGGYTPSSSKGMEKN
ncbi:hypothetical protein NLJ89_g5202 [Agrocybe chaxingu]|uniref:Uncharacterized protein n=1 Tax=Agrocybe chaxingu TaxID=84603 RepID=A0A9W8MX39_9AGAR|nr:hypothetical protein NLJ89_g5202 [Agrocybe chaxingu]